MFRLQEKRLCVGVAVSLFALSHSALEAQQVYQLSPSAFICQERQHHVIFDQLMQAGDTAAAKEYAEGRCGYLATDLQFEFVYGDLETASPQRRRVLETFHEELRSFESYWPRDKPAYVLIEGPRDVYIPFPGQPRERKRADPMERTFIQVRAIGDVPFFSSCYRCEALAWVRTQDLTPLEQPGP